MFRIIILIILLFAVQTSAIDLHKFSIRGSGSVFWNEGWGEKFFFQTFTQQEWEDILNGIIPDFNHTLRHTLYINPEIWWSTPISDKFSFSLTMKYEHLKFELRDSIHFSWIRWLKGLEADLNFFSIGARLGWIGSVQPYIGSSIGYCHGDLKTRHLLDPPDSLKYSVWLDGDGGGIFYDFLGGIIVPLNDKFDFFAEVGYRYTPGWCEFEPDNIYGDTESQVDWLYDNDRRLSRMMGWIISLGLQIGFS